MPHTPEHLLRGLRAAGDYSRLRLLCLLALGEFAVSELTEILGQSQPRVSRHLRLMTEAGLLERFRELHWVYYRMAAEGAGADIARALLGLLDRDDPMLVADRERATTILARRAAGAGTAPAVPAEGGSSVEDELAEVARAELDERGFDSLMYVGPAPAEVLRVLGPRARRVVGLSESRPEVQRARARLHGAGLAHCVLQQGDLQAVTGSSASFDVIVLDRVAGGRARPEQYLVEATRALKPGGRLVLVEDYDGLARRAAAGNPLAVVRDWLASGGLQCARMRPVDTGTTHLLVATGGPGAGTGCGPSALIPEVT